MSDNNNFFNDNLNFTNNTAAVGEPSSSLSSSTTSYLNNAQETAIAFVPLIPSLFSIVASACVIRLIHRRGYDSPSRRLLFGLSLFDILGSVISNLQSFLVPKETSRRLYAIGNDATCDVLGFFFQFNQGSYLYFAALSLYYVLVVKFSIKDPTFARRVEPFLHAFIFLFPLITGILGLVWDQYGEVTIGAGCWLAPNSRCDEECISSLELAFVGGPFSGCLAVVLLSNLIIFCHVRNTIYQGIKRSTQRFSQNMNNSGPDPAAENQGMNERQSKQIMSQQIMTQHIQNYSQEQVARVKRVRTQSALYCLVFIITYLWTVVLRLVSNSGGGSEQEPDLFVFMILRGIFLPGMGIGTLMVYVRPRYMTLRSKVHSKESRWATIRNVVWDDDDSFATRSSQAQSRNRISGAEEVAEKAEPALARRITGPWRATES